MEELCDIFSPEECQNYFKHVGHKKIVPSKPMPNTLQKWGSPCGIGQSGDKSLLHYSDFFSILPAGQNENDIHTPIVSVSLLDRLRIFAKSVQA
jgi:hypothetical protein